VADRRRHQERTQLVCDGPFAIVRNPIFSAMLPASARLALMVPSPLAIVGLLALFVAARAASAVVEEPYLLAVHSDGYASYASRVGRLVPRVGRVSDARRRAAGV
jgi:protein-S-isoprenylcysteine O-methyltransferase Ste14